MRLYETTFIVNPQTDDATIERQVQDVANLIATTGGKIVRDNRMGTRRLAYPIQGLTQGYYSNLVFEAPPDLLKELERHFRLGEAYLRHLTVVFEGSLTDPQEMILDQEADSRPEPRQPWSGSGPHGRRGGEGRYSRYESHAPAPAAHQAPASESPIVAPETSEVKPGPEAARPAAPRRPEAEESKKSSGYEEDQEL
jgi:small subunit ribosomal protein S6